MPYSEKSGTSDTGLILNGEDTEVRIFSTTEEEGGGAEIVGSGNTSFPSTDSPIKQSFGVNNKKIKKDEPTFSLNELITKNNQKLIGHLNINFIENKFEALVSLVKDKLDIIMISETKIDESFPETQFTIEGYSKPFRRDRNCNGGGLLIYIRDDISCKEINTHDCLMI